MHDRKINTPWMIFCKYLLNLKRTGHKVNFTVVFSKFLDCQTHQSKLICVILSDNISCRRNMAICDLAKKHICVRYLLHVFLWPVTVNSGAFMLQFCHLSATIETWPKNQVTKPSFKFVKFYENMVHCLQLCVKINLAGQIKSSPWFIVNV